MLFHLVLFQPYWHSFTKMDHGFKRPISYLFLLNWSCGLSWLPLLMEQPGLNEACAGICLVRGRRTKAAALLCGTQSRKSCRSVCDDRKLIEYRNLPRAFVFYFGFLYSALRVQTLPPYTTLCKPWRLTHHGERQEALLDCEMSRPCSPKLPAPYATHILVARTMK